MERQTAKKVPRASGGDLNVHRKPSGTRSAGSRFVDLQRSIGNRATQRLLNSPLIQTKLKVSTPGDRFEQEADRVADNVTRAPSPQGNSPTVSSRTQISRLQRKCTECENEAQRKPVEEGKPLEEEDEPLQKQPMEEDRDEMLQGEGQPRASQGVQSQIDSLRSGGGQPLPESARTYFEPRFGHDFGGVRLHTGAEGARAARSVNARAFTTGKDIAFGAGQYSPETSSGKALLAHELTHVVQQGGADAAIQRQHVPDTGFRYAPPATVKRSIVEIQGIVGATPDGTYGEDTRRAVEKYQGELKSRGLYTDTLDGKWGNNTEAAHVQFALNPTAQRKGYNCTGFATKTYKFIGQASTEAIYAKMTKLADCSKPCSPFFHKFFLWKYNLEQVNTKTGVSLGSGPDFHTVAGQTDKSGNGPAQVMSKNGPRPVEGPKPPLDWKPVTGPTIDGDGNPLPNNMTIRTGHVEECFCNDKLP